MKHLLAVDASSVIGTINSPVNDPTYTGDVGTGLGKIFSTGIQIFFLFAGLTTLFYLLWGALDWINSSGEKEKVQKAQNKITSAVIGLVLVVVAFVVFQVLMGTVLGGAFGGKNMQFKLPSIGN